MVYAVLGHWGVFDLLSGSSLHPQAPVALQSRTAPLVLATVAWNLKMGWLKLSVALLML